ncbi:MAG: YHYH protein, partial [Pseudomonadota bacterium]
PNITTESRMSPGFIEDYNNLFTLRVPTSPSLAQTSAATSLGPVGIAVSGVPIFNDQEGPNVALNLGVISGFDRSGAHTGPSTYHYHLEPRAISFDDDALIGVMADGFLIYGRMCYETPGTYPDDLDQSGGHFGVTQHSNGEVEYHYHVMNELYLNAYYLLFPGDYQGTPSGISN